MDKLFIFILSLIFQNLFFILKFRKSRNNEKNTETLYISPKQKLIMKAFSYNICVNNFATTFI